MLQKKQARLVALAMLLLILATLACGEEVSPTLVGQVTTRPSGEGLATAATETPVEELIQAPTEVGEVLTQVLYDQSHTTNGLLLDTGGDVDTEFVSVGSTSEQALRTGNGEVLSSTDGNRVEDYYMQFRIDDKFIFRGSPTCRPGQAGFGFILPSSRGSSRPHACIPYRGLRKSLGCHYNLSPIIIDNHLKMM